jgi:myo-inositol 2-dehydrogenase/D-chiro-inositol 1-dehydrogenase
LSDRAGPPVAIGIVGCGRVTRTRHVPALLGLDGIRVVAVADEVAEARSAVATALGGVPQCADLEALVDQHELDAVAVCVPAEAHTEVVLRALDAGKHVFVEKPLCLLLQDANEIRRRVEETGRALMVGFNLRHHPLVREGTAMIRSGALGQVVALQSTFASSFDYRGQALPWRFSRERGGGALIEMASHHFDLWRLLLDDEIDEVTVLTGAGGDEDATAAVAATTRSGIAVSLICTQRSANVNELMVFGTAGSLRLSPYRFDGLELQSTTQFAGDAVFRLRRLASALPSLRRNRGAFVASYRHEWIAFANAARGARPEPDVEDGLRNVEILSAVTASAAHRAPARVGEERARV